ncbi:hypothetical protein, partial [Rhizobium leguminosarum]|uniref:hypothetical protein n=1 Tax=Rhizobium leguminosarum TaxID=384 RepID=UPI003F94C01A
SSLIRFDYARSPGRFDLAEQLDSAPVAPQIEFGGPTETKVGDFDQAFAAAEVKEGAPCCPPDPGVSGKVESQSFATTRSIGRPII